MTLPSLNTRHFDRHDQPLLHHAKEQVRILRALRRKNLLDDVDIVAQRQASGICRDRGENLPPAALRDQHDAALAILIEKALGDPPESLEIAVAQRVGQRQHLQRPGHALHLGVEHEADAAHVLEHALGRVPPVLLVVVEDDAGREHDQRQRGSRHQKGETQGQRRALARRSRLRFSWRKNRRSARSFAKELVEIGPLCRFRDALVRHGISCFGQRLLSVSPSTPWCAARAGSDRRSTATPVS